MPTTQDRDGGTFAQLLNHDLAARIGLVGIVMVIVACLAGVYLADRQIRLIYVAYVDAALTNRTRENAARFEDRFAFLRGEMRTLAHLPAVNGLGNDLTRPDANSLEYLTDSLTTFATFRREYFELGYVAIDDTGKTVVRVQRIGDELKVTHGEDLQQAGGSDDVLAATQLQDDDIYFSEMPAEREDGVDRRQVRLATPVFDSDRQLTGVLVGGVDIGPLLDNIGAGNGPDVATYIINDAGDFLVHPEADGSAALADAEPARWREVVDGVSLDGSSSVREIVIGANTVRLAVRRMAVGEPPRVLYVAHALPQSRIDELVLKARSMLILVVVAIGVVLMAILGFGIRIALKPLYRLVDVAESIGSGEYDLSIPNFSGLTGLSGALRDMVEGIKSRNRELHRTNEVIEEGNARLKTILDSLTEGVVVANLDGLVIDFNPAAMEMHGFTSPEEYRRVLSAYADTFELHTLDGDLVSLPEWPLARVLRGENVVETELRVGNRKTGEHRVFSYSGRIASDDDGDPLLAIITMNNRTERRDMDDRIRAQLNHLGLLDQLTRAIAQRQDLASIFGVVTGSLKQKLPIDFGCMCLRSVEDRLDIVTHATDDKSLSKWIAVEENKKITIDRNGLQRCINGQLVYEPDISKSSLPFLRRLAEGGLCSVVLVPIKHQEQVIGALITARKEPQAFSSTDCEFLRQLSEHVALAAHQAQMMSALQRAYDDLRQTQQAVMQHERLRALGQMASGIAHDINNALSPVSLYTDSILENDTGLSERSRRYLVTIQRAVEDVTETVARMREFYRPREAQTDLSPMDLNVLIDQVVEYTRARWDDMTQREGITLRLVRELAPDLPPVMGVESEIRDALTNLIFNAVDAMPQGGTITMRSRIGVTSASAVVVEVIDEGMGMDEDTRKRCLEPFFTTKGERGTGLGLAMVFGVAERHDAELEVESQIGEGSTFRLVFPGQITRGETIAIDAITAAGAAMRLLVIDDDPLLLESLRDTLAGDGHEVVTASGGQEGIDAFVGAPAGRFHAVLTDLGMPYVDGRKVAETIKAHSFSTPVILLTGWGQRLVADDDIPPCVDHLIAKPPKLRDLRVVLQSLSEESAT